MASKGGSPVEARIDERRAVMLSYSRPHDEPDVMILISPERYRWLDQIEWAISAYGERRMRRDYAVPEEVWERIQDRGARVPPEWTDRDGFSWFCITGSIACFDMEAAFIDQMFALNVGENEWIEGTCIACTTPPFFVSEPQLTIALPTVYDKPVHITAPLSACRRVSLSWAHRMPARPKYERKFAGETPQIGENIQIGVIQIEYRGWRESGPPLYIARVRRKRDTDTEYWAAGADVDSAIGNLWRTHQQAIVRAIQEDQSWPLLP